MPLGPEDEAREIIDKMLENSGWHVCDYKDANIHVFQGVVLRYFPLKDGKEADYLFYVEGKAAGVIEAKKKGTTLSGVEIQSGKYTKGLPAGLPTWHNPLPFAYESTGEETQFTNRLDPDPRSRNVFSFHRPDTLLELLEGDTTEDNASDVQVPFNSTMRYKLQRMPSLNKEGLWPAQITAIKNLEKSLAENRPRALIQMATGSGKTYTAVELCYRLIKNCGAKRILFLVDRGNLGRQTMQEFENYIAPKDGRKFTELYNVNRLQTNTMMESDKVVISTIHTWRLQGRNIFQLLRAVDC